MGVRFKKVFLYCTIIVALFLMVLLGKCYQKKQGKKLIISPILCGQILGCDPNEFFEKNFIFYDETFDLRRGAYINENGDLVLILSNEDIKKWRELNTCDFAALVERGIYVSEDYKTVVLEYETKNDIFFNLFEAASVSHSLLVNQLLDGVVEQEIRVDFSIKNAKTKETIYSIIYPDAPIEFHSEDYDFLE